MNSCWLTDRWSVKCVAQNHRRQHVSSSMNHITEIRKYYRHTYRSQWCFNTIKHDCRAILWREEVQVQCNSHLNSASLWSNQKGNCADAILNTDHTITPIHPGSCCGFYSAFKSIYVLKWSRHRIWGTLHIRSERWWHIFILVLESRKCLLSEPSLFPCFKVISRSTFRPGGRQQKPQPAAFPLLTAKYWYGDKHLPGIFVKNLQETLKIP